MPLFFGCYEDRSFLELNSDLLPNEALNIKATSAHCILLRLFYSTQLSENLVPFSPSEFCGVQDKDSPPQREPCLTVP